MKKWIIWTVLISLLLLSGYYFFPEPKLPSHKKIDKLVVFKSQHLLEVYAEGKVIKQYKIALGQQSTGHKQYEGDKRTPEGVYIINDKNPNSGYHKNLGISYPNKKDREEAKQKSLSPGGEIKIHGLKNGIGFIGKFHRFMDWTAGCIAVTDSEIDELYNQVDIGTPIYINP